MPRKKKEEAVSVMGVGEAPIGSEAAPTETAPTETAPVQPEGEVVAEVKPEWVKDESLVGKKHCGKMIVSSEMKADGSFYRFKDEDGSSFLFHASETNPEKRLIQP